MIANLPALPFKHSLKVPQQLSASHSGGTAPVDELVDFTVIGQDHKPEGLFYYARTFRPLCCKKQKQKNLED
jgi:hypothetical protein